MKGLSFRAVLYLIFFYAVSVFAYSGHFVTGSIHTSSAVNVNKGAVLLNGNASVFNHHEIFIGVNNIESGYMVWDSKTVTVLKWGVSDHLQLGVLPILTQSTHNDSERVDVPADVWLSAQLGTLGYGKIRYGARMDVRLPLAAHQNIPLQTYTADCNSYAVTGLFSFHFSDNLRMDANIGGIQHMDKGLFFQSVQGDSVQVAQQSSEIFAGSSVHYFWQEYAFFAEIWSRGFLNAPPPNVYARENSAQLSFGFAYQFNEWIQIAASFNKLLFGKKDETSYLPAGQAAVQKYQSVSNYPDWKLNVGVEIAFRHGSAPKIKERSVRQNKKLSRADHNISAAREHTIVRTDGKPKDSSQSEQALEIRKMKEREKMQVLLSNLRDSLEASEESN